MTQERDVLREYYRDRGEAFLGEVDSAHIEQVIADLVLLSQRQEEVTLVISSPGGVTEAGFRLAQFIEQEFKTPLTARVWGQCSSAATYVLLCCKKRIAHPQSTFVLHRQTASIELDYTDDFKHRVKEWLSDNKATHHQQLIFYSRTLRLKKKEVEKLLLRGMGIDAALSAVQALKLGLITDITQF